MQISNTKKIPLVKYADPGFQTGEFDIPGRLYTSIIWGIIFVLGIAVCLYYSLTKPIVITSANVRDEKIFDINEKVPLSLSGPEQTGYVVFTVPEGVAASDIVTQNLYNERKFLVHINTEAGSYYGSFSPEGIPVDAGRITGDSALVSDVGVLYDRTGALLVFDMSGIYEYSLTIEGNAVTMEAVKPDDMYGYIVVIDPENGTDAAGVSEDVAKRCASILDKEGVRVYVTDPSLMQDVRIPAAELVEETGADLYISLGVSHEGAEHHGIRTYYDPLYYVPGYGSIQLCESLLRNTAIESSNRALGINEAPEGSVLYDIGVSSAHLILGNADNSDEGELLREETYRDRLARGICKAVIEASGQTGDE